jgi:hypothetical protein
MASWVFALTGNAGSFVSALAGKVLWARSPAATAPLVLRKFRRFSESGDFFMNGLEMEDVSGAPIVMVELSLCP